MRRCSLPCLEHYRLAHCASYGLQTELPHLFDTGVARHRLVQNARSRPNSETASLHPECKQICAVHAPAAYTHNSTPFSCQCVGRKPMETQYPSVRAISLTGNLDSSSQNFV